MSTRRVRAGSRTLTVTHLEKVLYPEARWTKAHLLAYYARMATVLLPHVRGRALTLRRFPDGVRGESFYEKRCPRFRPPWMQVSPDLQAGHHALHACVLQDRASLLWVINLAALELHVRLDTVDHPGRPTMVVFDLDPGPPAGLAECARVALSLRDLLRALKLTTFVKTSGGKGLHLMVPLNTPVTFAQTKPFARAVAAWMQARQPDLVESRMTKQLRTGKVFVDWGQNDPHKTMVCPYSLRAGDRPRVSMPLTWVEVEQAVRRRTVRPLVWEPEAALRHVARHGDAFRPVLTRRQQLPAGPWNRAPHRLRR